MKYTVLKSNIRVIGKIWMPSATCAKDYDLSDYDIENIIGEAEFRETEINRDAVEYWLMLNSGDFQSIEDFSANIELPDGVTFISDWRKEESECTYCDCMYPAED